MKFDLRQATLAAVLTLVVSGLALDAWAQSAADPWAQVKKDAQTSESNQRTPAVQARIQQWFVAKIQAYQNVLNDTALGKASPKIIDLGDFTAHLRRILAPPTGNGTAVVVFTDEVDTASTMEDTMDILFPKRSAVTYIDLHFNTCWHEFQHSIALVSERNGRAVAVNPGDWTIYRKPPVDDVAEHVYIESLGEYAVEWLDYLLRERSTLRGGAPGLAFEKHCRDAYEQMKQYQARNESVSYAVENYCWAKAHQAWVQGWKLAKLVAPLHRGLREDYKQIHGVWIGFVEDIIKFYMDGGLTAKDGKKMRVPEWVMWEEPMKSGIIIGHLNERNEVQNNTLRCGFDVRVLESYRRKERSDSLNHGVVHVALDNPDADSRLELAVDGKPMKRSGTSGKIDLSGLKADSRIGITLARGNLSKLAGKKRYRILVDYKDDPRIVNGKQQPSFYYASRAIYYVDVSGTGGAVAPASATAKPAAKSQAAPAAKPGPQARATGRWVLKDATTNKRVDDMWKSQTKFRFNASVELTGVGFETVYTEKNPKQCYTKRTKHSWNHPGQTLTPGTTVDVVMTVTDDGSVNVDSTKGGIDAHCSLRAVITPNNSRMGSGVFVHPASNGPSPEGGGVGIVPGSPRQSKSFTCKMPVRNGDQGDKLLVRISSMQGPTMTDVEFHYVYERGAAVAAETRKDVDVKLVAEEPKPKPDPEQLDNDPPPPGKVIRIKPAIEEKDPKPRKPRVAEQWYTHAKGDYKLRLPDGWSVSQKRLFDEADNDYDTLWSPGRDMAVICARGYSVNYSDAAQAAAVKRMLEGKPNAKSGQVNVGKIKAGIVAEFVKEEGVMGWQVVFHYNKRGYHISVSMPANAKPPRMPDPPAWMLGSAVMLR